MEDSIGQLVRIVETIGEVGDNRHSELMMKIGDVIKELSKPAVRVEQVDLSKLEEAINKIRIPDNSEIVSAVKGLTKVTEILSAKIEQLKVMDKEEKKPTEWVFDIKRHNGPMSPAKTIHAKAILN